MLGWLVIKTLRFVGFLSDYCIINNYLEYIKDFEVLFTEHQSNPLYFSLLNSDVDYYSIDGLIGTDQIDSVRTTRETHRVKVVVPTENPTNHSLIECDIYRGKVISKFIDTHPEFTKFVAFYGTAHLPDRFDAPYWPLRTIISKFCKSDLFFECVNQHYSFFPQIEGGLLERETAIQEILGLYH